MEGFLASFGHDFYEYSWMGLKSPPPPSPNCAFSHHIAMTDCRNDFDRHVTDAIGDLSEELRTLD
jgi:hypothetical protein